MIALRSLLAGLMALLLTVTAAGLAMARGDTGAAGRMVICSDAGPVVIHLDANGQPVEGPRFCPDALMGLMGAVAAPALGPAADHAPRHAQIVQLNRLGHPTPVAGGGARDPPQAGQTFA